jgi:predicted anti-sigma-YlaC factor YlaD
VDDAGVDAHLARCDECARWRADVQALQRSVRITAAPELEDETDRFVGAVRSDQLRRTVSARRLVPVRLGLVAVGLAQLYLAAPNLLLGHDAAAPAHVAHEMGAFTVALGAGLLLAAWRPRLATGMVPIFGILSALLVLTAWIDVVLRYTAITQEWPHLLEVVGFVLLLRLAYLSNDRDWTPLLIPLRRSGSGPRAGGGQELAAEARAQLPAPDTDLPGYRRTMGA